MSTGEVGDVQLVESKTGPPGHPKGPPRTQKWLTIRRKLINKAGYTATPVACGWAGAIFEVTRAFGQEQWSQRLL